MEVPLLGPLKISTRLHVGETMIGHWATSEHVDDVLAIYHPQPEIVNRLLTRVQEHHQLLTVNAVAKTSLPAFLRAICRALGLREPRTGYDCARLIEQSGTPIHIAHAHLLNVDHLSQLSSLAEGHGHRVVLSSTASELVSLICDRRDERGPHFTKFCFPNIADI